MDLRFARGLQVRSIVASVGEEEGWVTEEVMLVTLVSRTISLGGVSSLGSRAEEGHIFTGEQDEWGQRRKGTFQRHSENIIVVFVTLYKI